MTRVVDPFRFYARAALTDWSHINRARDPNDPRWQREWARRRIDGTSMAQLRWSINPQLHPALPDFDWGMPSGPFTVWARLPSEKNLRDLEFFTYLNQEGATMIGWTGAPLVYVLVTISVSGASANLSALNGPLALDSIEAIQSVGTGTTEVVLGGTSIRSVAISSDGPVGVLKVVGITANDYANSDEWKPIEIVGLPVDQGAWAGVDRHSEAQGMLDALGTPVDAARERLRRGAAPFGWANTIGAIPAPLWELPDFDGLIHEVQQDALPRLHPVMQLPPLLQARQRDQIAIPGPTGSGGTLGEPSHAILPPLGLALVAAGSDPLLALALGFGTAYRSERFSGVPGTSLSLLINRNIPDYMVTAIWDRGMDGGSAPLEMAALAIGAAPPIRPLPPAAMQAQVQTRDRPAAPDQPWTSAARVSWDRLPRHKTITTASFALARANPATPAVAADAVMRVRPGGGHAPITLTRNAKDKESVRHSAVDSSLVLPLTDAGLALRYGVALQDIWGVWSAWGTVNYTDKQPHLDRPRILKCSLDASEPAAGRVCDGVLTVDLAWDWEVRRPQSIELRCRLFPAPARSYTPPPDLSLPAGMQMQLGVPPGGALTIAFDGDVVADPLPAGVVVAYFDIDGTIIPPGPAGDDDVRRYRITISGFRLDYTSVGHVGLALWSRVKERAAPYRDSDWLAPLVAGSAVEPGPNIAYASDPIPPVPEPPELVKRASLADARGEHHARVAWAPSAGAVGYFIYTASESAILGAVDEASKPAPDPTRTYTERLAVLRTLLAADTHRTVFARTSSKAQQDTSADLVLPRGTKEIHLFTMVAVNAGNIESDWPTTADAEERFLAIAAAGIVTPAPPQLEIRRVDRPAGSPSFAVHVRLTSQPGARVSRYQLFRTRVEAAAMHLDTMGPPVATVTESGAGWAVETAAGDATALHEALGADAPEGSWKKLWYRAVAWAHQDNDRALLAGRSPPSNAMSVVIPPDGPPNLSGLIAEWPGGPLQNVLVRFSSSAPLAVTALGPHKLSVNVQVLSGPSKADAPQLLLENLTLDTVGTTAPAGTGLWRTSAAAAFPARYSLRLNRGAVNDRIAVVVRLTDPLGRSTERVLNIDAGPVDPMPDVLDLEMHAAGVNVINATWRSSAPLAVRAGGKYTIRVTIVGPNKPPVVPRPPVLPVLPLKPKRRGRAMDDDAGASVASIMGKPQTAAAVAAQAAAAVAAQAGGLLRGPFVTLPGATSTIEMGLGDVPLAGRAPPPTPERPWQLVRQNGAAGVTSYGLTFNGSAVSVRVRITAPDGRFAEKVAR